ncbi:MAG: protein-glutamate O-methyltransferase CheR [Epsilonproteobacteria bacterium]|nr:protein-glutamate O-methyltransferase CheR [Campylobacterota bacterium]
MILTELKDITGIDFFIKESVIRNKLDIFCVKNDIPKEKLPSLIKTSPALKQKLINYLTTTETYFFREKEHFEEMIKDMQKRKILYPNILSIPSSSGEEPYSIAIYLYEHGFSDFKITGVDINEEVINHAKKGIYKKIRFRNTPHNIIEKYFDKVEGDKYKIKDFIKEKVDFRVMNIFDKNIYTLGKFDYIFCRNLFIYFDEETKQKAKSILQSLKKEPNSPIYFGHADLF